jgi:hypothetical protein
MKGTTGLISILSITGLLGATILFAQPGPHSRGGGQADQYGGGMNTNRMERRKEMMAEHQKMMAEMKRMDAELDQKVAEMNQAQGSAKLDAMAAAINDLVKERKLMHEHMAQMLGRRMSHMHPGPGAMGGSEAGPTGGSSGTGGGPNQP